MRAEIVIKAHEDLDQAWAEFEDADWGYRPRVLNLLDHIPNWHFQSACGDLSEADLLFFGEETNDVRPALGRGQVRDARKICDSCPVRRECLTHALTTPEKYGIWAGTTGRGRVAILRMMRAQRVSLEVVVDEVLSLSGRPV